jgi:hypothetical protein
LGTVLEAFSRHQKLKGLYRCRAISSKCPIQSGNPEAPQTPWEGHLPFLK